MLDDGLSERAAIMRVLGRLGERTLRKSDGSSSHERPSDIESSHRNLRPDALVA